MNIQKERIRIKRQCKKLADNIRLGVLISRAYAAIGDLTPLPVDCGQLCGAACCNGDDDMGMLLFPGEAIRFADRPGFRVLRIPYMGGKAWFLSCREACDRGIRPLACRMFPLAPLVDENGRVTAVPDPRGRPMCPLAEGTFIDARFRQAVGRAFRILGEDAVMLEFMRRISREVQELQRLIP